MNRAANFLRTRRTRRGTRAGLSLSEVSYFLAILLLLVSIALPVRESIRLWQRNAMARGDLRSIVSAVRNYHTRYNLWPGHAARNPGDIHYGTRRNPNSEIMNILRAAEGPSNPGHAANTNRIIFLAIATAEPGLSGLNETGEFLDPWGTPYNIVLDLDYDDLCNVAQIKYQRIKGEGLIAWSSGPDRISETEDDLRSWKWTLPRKIATPGGGY